MLALPADHYIRDLGAYRDAVRSGIGNLGDATGVVFGIPPVRPETGYGYILTEGDASAAGCRRVVRFVEKPDAPTAARYLADGRYFWNSGMFLWRNRTLLELFETHMPELYDGLCRLRPHVGMDESHGEIYRIFPGLPRISIDFGILEKASGLRMIPARFGWDDIGTWSSLERVLPADAHANIRLGSTVTEEATGCILYAQTGSIAAFGVSDLVIVEAHGNVLVCSKDRTPDLKKLVEGINSREH